MARPKGNPASRKIEIEKRQRMAVEYRALGMSFRAIGETLGVSDKQVAEDVENALARERELSAATVESLRELENERLDLARRVIAAKVRSGDLGAVDRWIKIAERAAKLNGLDAPQLIAPTTPDGTQSWNPDFSKMSAAELDLFETLCERLGVTLEVK